MTLPYTRAEVKDRVRNTWKGACNVTLPSFTSSFDALNAKAIEHDIRLGAKMGYWGTLVASESGTTFKEYLQFMEIAAGAAPKGFALLASSVEHERGAEREPQLDDRGVVGRGERPCRVVHRRDRTRERRRRSGAFRLACGSLNDRGLACGSLDDRGLACGSLNDRGLACGSLNDRSLAFGRGFTGGRGAVHHDAIETRSDATARGGSVTVILSPSIRYPSKATGETTSGASNVLWASEFSPTSTRADRTSAMAEGRRKDAAASRSSPAVDESDRVRAVLVRDRPVQERIDVVGCGIHPFRVLVIRVEVEDVIRRGHDHPGAVGEDHAPAAR